jgi:hypothetical protein
MENNEKIKTIAEYDGWVVKGNTATKYDLKGEFLKGDHVAFVPTGMCYSYLTSLDWLHPVAMKVLSELYKIKGELAHTGKIVNNCSRCSVSGKYIDLFNAVYDGIVYLKSQHNG